MQQVSKEQYYAFILPQDVVCSVTGLYPYTSYWKTRQGDIVGKKVVRYAGGEHGVGSLIEEFFINRKKEQEE